MNCRYRIKNLYLSNFRNHVNLSLNSDCDLVIIHGPNGSGKTSILEAISLLCPGLGLQGAAARDIAHHHCGNWGANFNIYANTEQTEEECSNIGIAWQDQHKSIQINGKNEPKSSALSSHIKLVWVTPTTTRILSSPGSDRVKFFDRLAYNFYPQHLTNLLKYNFYKKERNLIIQNGGARDWLEAIEKIMSSTLVDIAQIRIAFSEMLNAEQGFAILLTKIEPRGEAEALLRSGHDADQVKMLITEKLRNSYSYSQKTHRTGLNSPDFTLHYWHDGWRPAKLASTGEQKIFVCQTILNFVQSSIKNGYNFPVILIDDLSAHLDCHKSKSLLSYLLSLGCQVWLTDTELKDSFLEKNSIAIKLE